MGLMAMRDEMSEMRVENRQLRQQVAAISPERRQPADDPRVPVAVSPPGGRCRDHSGGGASDDADSGSSASFDVSRALRVSTDGSVARLWHMIIFDGRWLQLHWCSRALNVCAITCQERHCSKMFLCVRKSTMNFMQWCIE